VLLALDCNPFIQGMVNGLVMADLGGFKVSMETLFENMHKAFN